MFLAENYVNNGEFLSEKFCDDLKARLLVHRPLIFEDDTLTYGTILQALNILIGAPHHCRPLRLVILGDIRERYESKIKKYMDTHDQDEPQVIAIEVNRKICSYPKSASESMFDNVADKDTDYGTLLTTHFPLCENAFAIKGRWDQRFSSNNREVRRRELSTLKTDLVADFQKWLFACIPVPAPETETYLWRYLLAQYATLHLGSGVFTDLDTWDLRMVYYGVGQETSALLSAHWMYKWYQKNHQEILDRHLKPFGFSPLPVEDHKWPAEGLVFFPFQGVCYAHARGYSYEIDKVIRKRLESPDLDLKLRACYLAYLPKLRTGECLCQLCSPEIYEPIRRDNELVKRLHL